ncbi:hypothetical protein [Burkholderia pseudomallei]|uniref:hypothetical protein n=1 Tax=Burkholderia pseudomallei TaxID=28450 RepID=UPI000429AA8B|nr:hypothetical protein [Burkholderia pseudomallei]MBM5618815.1 hypothetical protein [Burkholderia pseudomallei]MBM5629023.1 hypothetical protein [Burkholderia pseudomallei]MBM5656826.1 hypothetical protein [Burkholderia pseudomallei]
MLLLFRRSGAFGTFGTFGTCVRRDSRVLPGRRFGGLPRGVALGAVAVRVRRRMRARGIDA